MEIRITKKQIIELLTNVINNNQDIEEIRSFTSLWYLGDDDYILESEDIKNFFTIVENYNTHDAAFGDPNQKFTLTRLRDALIKYSVWEEEMLIAMVSFDEIESLNVKLLEGEISRRKFKTELKKYCYDRNDINKILNYYYFYKEKKKSYHFYIRKILSFLHNIRNICKVNGKDKTVPISIIGPKDFVNQMKNKFPDHIVKIIENNKEEKGPV